MYSCQSDEVNSDAVAPTAFNNDNLPPGPPSTMPVLGIRFSVESDLISVEDGCWTVQVRCYITFIETGEKYLSHSATVQTGPGCDPPQGSKSYKGDFIIHDDMPRGEPIDEIFDAQPEVYSGYVAQRDAIIART